MIPVVEGIAAVDDDGDRSEPDHQVAQVALLENAYKKTEAEECGNGTEAEYRHDDAAPQSAGGTGGGDSEEEESEEEGED